MSAFGSLSSFRGNNQSSSALINSGGGAPPNVCLILGRTAVLPIADATGFVLIPFDTIINASSVATNNAGLITINQTGIYNLSAACLFSSLPPLPVNQGARGLRVLVNGAIVVGADNAATAGSTQGMICNQFVPLNAGDIVTTEASSNVGQTGQTVSGNGFNPILTSLALALL